MKNLTAATTFSLMLALVTLPSLASAAEVIQLADNSDAPRRFMSLASERDGTARAQKKIVKSGGLRSDSTALRQGFMLLDRGKAVPTGQQHALIVPSKNSSGDVASAPQVVRGVTPSGPVPAANIPVDSEEISDASGNADPVLGLFGGGSKGAPVASFRDALRGKGVTASARPGKFSWPIPSGAQQKLSSGYGWRDNPFGGKPEFHGGIDISAPTGTSVLACADGVISKTGFDARYGKYIVLSHADGSVSQYGHLSMQSVHDGQQIRRGQVIGAVGATGRATGSHLDFRVSMNGERVNPLSMLSAPGAAGVTVADNRSVEAARPAMRQAQRSLLIEVH